MARTVDRCPAVWRRRGPLLALLLAVTATPAAAQQTSLATVRRELDRALDDIGHVWTAPFRTHGRDLPPLLAATAPGALLAVFDGEIQQWVRSHESSWPVRLLGPVRDQGALNHVGRTYFLAALSTVLFLVGAGTDDADLRDAGLGCATANLATTLPRATGSRLVGRRRPLAGEGPYSFRPFTFNDWNSYSLPGGHVANIAACTSFWNHRFDLGAVEPLLYAFTVAMGVGRIIDEAHWASDTWFGIAFGWAVGRLIANRMSERRAAASGSPVPQQLDMPLYVGWRFTF